MQKVFDRRLCGAQPLHRVKTETVKSEDYELEVGLAGIGQPFKSTATVLYPIGQEVGGIELKTDANWLAY